jgi:RHS repeat-associated protein
VAFTTDQNGATSYAHFMDALDRLTRTKDATAGWKVFSHPSTTEQDTYTGITDATPSVGCNGCRHDQMIFDGLARLTRSSVVNDPDGQINTDIGYDTNGRANAVSNPYRPGTPDTTDGVTTLRFDALDRIDQTTQPDNTTLLSLSGAALGGGYSQVCNNGAGYPNLKVDERGNKRLLWSDGLDRLIEVDEQSSPGGALNWATCYQYTVSGNSKVTTVTQKGGSTNSADWRVRTFVYDPASRLTSAATPEGGATTYSYLGSSGFCAGDQTLPCTRTDARRVTTTYSYDALNRLTGKSYSATTPPTPSVTYFYDQPSYNGLTIVNGQGRRTGMLDGSGKTAWSYDAMGRVVAKAQTISPDGSGLASMNEMTLYSPYNYDGSVSAVTYPSNRVVSYAYNQSQRAVSATDNTSIYTHFVSSAHYDAPGMLTSATHGDGINDINHFNNRIQPTLLSAASGSQSLLNLTYGYQQTTPSIANNGTVLQMVNGLRNPGDNRSLAFTYDQVNRLQTAGTLSDATSPWTTTYSYDPWGNLYQKSTTGTGAGNGEVNQGPFSVDNHNRLNPDTFAYDAAGNMQSDIYNPLNFDGENQVHPASGIQYYYDGDGHRVAKSDGSRYWYDDNFKVLFTADASNTLKRDYFYFNGTRLGWVTVASGDAHYYLNDHLGSPRVIANGDGSFIGWEADYRPYGQDNVISNNDGLDVFYLSTGYEYDYEMNPDADYYANLRYMSASLGRFFQPDPVGGDPTNPQSWNRYAYVLNSPCTLYDQLGLDVCTLNIGLTGTSHLSDPNLLALEQNLRKLFAGADVNLSFSSGTGDLNLQLVKGEYNFLLSGTPSGVLGYTDASTRTSAVALDRIGPSIIATSRVSAHELGHAILWLSHTTGSPDFRQGIMQSGTALSALLYSNSADANAAYQFTPLQQQGIKAFCKLKHGNSSNGGGGGQDRFNDDDGGRFEGIGSEFDWLDLLYGPKPYHGIR